MLPPSLPPFLRPASPNHTKSKDTVTVFPTRLLDGGGVRAILLCVSKSQHGASKSRPLGSIGWVGPVGLGWNKLTLPGGPWWSHCYSVAKSCLTLFDPMDCSTIGFPVLHHLPEFAQTHVHQVGDAIQPSHPPSSPSPADNLSQHQGLFQ